MAKRKRGTRSGLPEGEPIEVIRLEGEPLVVYGHDLTELRFMRRLKVKDLVWVGERGFDSPEEKQYLMLHRVTGIPTSSLQELDAYDFNMACGVLGGFMLRGPKTGKSSSESSVTPSASDEAT